MFSCLFSVVMGGGENQHGVWDQSHSNSTLSPNNLLQSIKNLKYHSSCNVPLMWRIQKCFHCGLKEHKFFTPALALSLNNPTKSISQQVILEEGCLCLTCQFIIFHFVDSSCIPLLHHRPHRHQMTVQTSWCGEIAMNPKLCSLSVASTHGPTALWELSQWRRN